MTFASTCSASTPACGQTTAGTNNCGAVCTRTGQPCSQASTWVPYGFAVPGDPVYGFPDVVDASGTPAYPNPNTQDLFGFAAKGNIILGDYTSTDFQQRVLPILDGGAASKTQPYAIDQSDESLGYHTGNGVAMNDSQGRPLFDGNYNRQDEQGGLPGQKLDGSPRKFYESTLSDAAFQTLATNLAPSSGSTFTIEGVLFTNHALAGYVPNSITINGAMVSRDDGLIFNGTTFRINHDIRLLGDNDQLVQQIALPVSVQRPTLQQWKECPPSGC